MSEQLAYECDGCGKCCRHLLIEAYAADVLREPRINETRSMKGRSVGLHVLDCCWVLNDIAGDGMACVFLTAENRCGIYATRPETCVAFAAGSERCQEVRTDAGLPRLQPVPVGDSLMREINAGMVEAQNEDE